jgi:hypothetical protein
LTKENKKIFIVDEPGFSRICSAILNEEGLEADIHNAYSSDFDSIEFQLIIASIPFCEFMFDKISNRSIPKIFLSDQIDPGLIRMLEENDNAYCMIKPIDFNEFRSLVSDLLNGRKELMKGYAIL